MPNLTSVGLTAGAATSGTGTVSTIDNLIGTAGTASAQVLTVQGIASGTAQAVSGTVTANATLAAETTKVIGVTRTADGAGNLTTSTANALDVNIKSGLNTNGRKTPANSEPVVQASQTYETVAASQTAQVMGGAGATGDWLDGILVIPATVDAGNVILIDNATSITVFVGGTASVSNLIPFFIPIGCVSASGPWKITTGTNVSAIGIGNFT